MKRVVMASVALMLGSAAAAAQTVGLDEYLERVRMTHPYFAKEQMQAAIEEKQRDRFLGVEDWIVEASPTLSYSEPLRTSPFVPDNVKALRLDASAGRLFWRYGSQLSVGWRTDITDQDLAPLSVPGPTGPIDIPIGPTTFYEHAFRAVYSMPLLRNKGGKLNRLEYDLSRFDVDISRVTSLENQESFLLEVALKFLDWSLLDEQRRIARDRLALAEEELERTRRKRRSNLVDEADVLRAADAVQTAGGAVLAIDARWKAVRAELAELAGWSDVMSRAPAFDLYARPALDSVAVLIDRAGENSRLIEVLSLQRSQLLWLEDGLEERARPELALNLSGALKGGSDAFDRSLEIKEPDVAIGLELRYPIGNRTASADVEKTHLQLRQIEKAMADVTVTLRANVSNVLVQARELEKVIALNQEQIETARRKTAEEIKLYNQGRGDLTFVIQSRDNEATSRLAYAENAAWYQRLVLQYRALADELLAGVVE